MRKSNEMGWVTKTVGSPRDSTSARRKFGFITEVKRKRNSRTNGCLLAEGGWQVVRAFLRGQLARHPLVCEREQLRGRAAEVESVEVYLPIEIRRDDA